MPQRLRNFASDNNAGTFPEILDWYHSVNEGHLAGYGDDWVTKEARRLISEVFETDCAVYFAATGTSANCLALSDYVQSYEAIVVHEFSHLEEDECHAIGHFIPGARLLPVGGKNAKLTSEQVRKRASAQRPIHGSKPRALSITNATELGTVYRPEEIGELSSIARFHDLAFHVDGARFANALVHLGCSPAELTWKSGVDCLTFGATKNGLAFGEAILFFDGRTHENFPYRLKQSGQLASKMRFLAGPWLAYLKADLWLERARHANRMAQRLADGLKNNLGMKIGYPVEANAVFVDLPAEAVAAMQKKEWRFYNDIGPDGLSRLMCSWDTAAQDVDDFLDDLRRSLAWTGDAGIENRVSEASSTRMTP